MTTAAQVAANKLNALRSTGAATSEGRAKSALNSRRHGLRSDSVALLPSEDRGEWESLLSGLRNDWQPETETEELLVEKMAAAEWKRRRSEHFEVGCLLMERAAEDGAGTAAWRDANKAQAIGLVVRYRRSAEAAFTAAMHSLERAQARRNGAAVPVPLVVDVGITGEVGEEQVAVPPDP